MSLVVLHTEEFKERACFSQTTMEEQCELHLTFLHFNQLVTGIRLSSNVLWKS